MDFRKLTPIGKNINNNYEQIIFGKGYDHNWVLNTNGSDNKKAAQVIDENSGIVMEVSKDGRGESSLEVQTPKTQKGKRQVSIPNFLVTIFKQYKKN